MRIFTLIFFFLLAFATSNAQKDCNFYKNAADDFTGKQTVITKVYRAAGNFLAGEYFNLVLIREGEDFSVRITFQSGQIVDKSNIDSTDQLLLKLQNDVVSLHSRQSYKSQMMSIGDILIKALNSDYVVSKADFQKLVAQSIEKIRYTLDSGSRVFNFEVNPKNAAKILEGAACVWKTLK